MSDEEATRAATLLIGHAAVSSLQESHIAIVWEADADRRCETCACLDMTWFPNGPNEPPVAHCAAESCTCAPNGFDEWVPKDYTHA